MVSHTDHLVKLTDWGFIEADRTSLLMGCARDAPRIRSAIQGMDSCR